ncbi:MAG: exosome complex RNA-binding protein Csl4 [Desulfurococcales archaeon]|nr:exosome complex RNA-binding protein Csl4 [Desulfurococcales archaeon]
MVSERWVFPGTVLGVIEEYFPGSYVYELDGRLYSSVIGVPRLDMVRRVVWIDPVNRVQMPSPGSMVYAYVVSVRDESSLLRIVATDLRRPYKQGYVGILHISQARQDPSERSLSDIIRVGDMVLARVLSKNNPYILSLKVPRAGIVLTMCPKCVSYMRLKGGRLACPRCGFEESRRVSPLYLSI